MAITLLCDETNHQARQISFFANFPWLTPIPHNNHGQQAIKLALAS